LRIFPNVSQHESFQDSKVSGVGDALASQVREVVMFFLLVLESLKIMAFVVATKRKTLKLNFVQISMPFQNFKRGTNKHAAW
jgi:hypothetical protein